MIDGKPQHTYPTNSSAASCINDHACRDVPQFGVDAPDGQPQRNPVLQVRACVQVQRFPLSFNLSIISMFSASCSATDDDDPRRKVPGGENTQGRS